MELDHGIGQDIAHVDLLALMEHVRVFVHHQPAAVREPEAPVRVVGVSIGLRVLVVDTMIPHPVEDGVLAGNGEADGKDDPQR